MPAKRKSSTAGKAPSKAPNQYPRRDYISPFDIGGVIPGNPHLNPYPTSHEDFEAKYGSGSRALRAKVAANDEHAEDSDDSGSTIIAPTTHTIAFGDMPPVSIQTTPRKAPRATSKTTPQTTPETPTKNPAKRAQDTTMGHLSVVNFIDPRLPPHKIPKERIFLLGPFRMIRAECAKNRDSNNGMKEFAEWLDRTLPDNRWKVTSFDPVIPGLVYSVRQPISDENLRNYYLALEFFPHAKQFNDMLSVGSFEFDRVTEHHKGPDGMLTRPLLCNPGYTLDVTLAMLVRKFDLGIPWDWSCPLLRPDVLPKELGGKLQDYRSFE